MKAYKSLTKEELKALCEELEKAYIDVKGKGLNLNMARGKPSKEQLNLSMDMLNIYNPSVDPVTPTGVDTRNYGELTGIAEARELMAGMIGVPASNVIVFGNASLPIMYDTVARSYMFGVNGQTPWCKLDEVKFLCPVPGYDRHFAITEQFGVKMIPIPLLADGPDMDMVREYVEKDDTVKGIWCVPKYANPTGITYSDKVVKAMAALKPAAKDFRIFWDNAYAVHDLYEDKKDELLDILSECKMAGNENMVYEFCSTSKISFAGAGISAMATSAENLDWVKKTMTVQTIGYDKMNQYRHVLYFKNADGIKAHMAKHAAILRPKFDNVLKCFDEQLGELDIATWTKPNGGYFISFNAMDGCAKEIVAKCKEAGVVLTGAGATYPYGKDPKDSNIRIAPSFPSAEEMAQAAEVFVLCVKLVTAKKLYENM
ncbi:MAG: aminotransferase class I/II-fold pyridoxal phosphate-dependent enzyme [Lachnospiraceae bacterium]|nr:aminotransferase class I/II-fold pyridoxal phosphate-dependent enzyme [Candidatus Colinaster equi]